MPRFFSEHFVKKEEKHYLKTWDAGKLPCSFLRTHRTKKGAQTLLVVTLVPQSMSIDFRELEENESFCCLSKKNSITNNRLQTILIAVGLMCFLM